MVERPVLEMTCGKRRSSGIVALRVISEKPSGSLTRCITETNTVCPPQARDASLSIATERGIPGGAEAHSGAAAKHAKCRAAGSQMPKPKKPKIVPRLGPAKNLRKAGAHEDKRRKDLERIEAKEQEELDELKAFGSWAYDED